MLSHSISSRLSQTLSPIGANCSFTLLRTHGGEGKYGGKCLTLLQELKGGGAPERFMSSLANLKQSNSPCPPNSLNSSISLALSIQSAAISSSHRTTPSTLHPLSTSCGRRPLITPSPAYLFLNLSTILNNKLSIRPQGFSALYNSPLVQWNRLQIVILAMEGVGEKEEKIVKGYRELCGAVGGRVWIWKGGNNRKINKLAEALTSSYTIPDLLPSSLLNHILTTPTLPYEIAPDAKKKSALPNITLSLGFNGQRFICDCTFLVQPVVQLREGEEPTDFPLLRPPTSPTPTIPFPDSPPNKPKSTYPNLTLLPTQPNAHCLTCLKPISGILEKFKMMKKGDRRIYYEMYFIQELRIPEGIYDAVEIIDRESKIEFGIVYKIAGNPGGVLIVCAPFIKMLGELTVKSLGISQAFFEKMKGKNTTIRPTPTGKLREEFKSFAGLVPPCYSDSVRNWCKVMDSAFAEDLTRHLPKVTYENANGRAEGEKARVFLDEGRKGGEGVEVDYRGVYEEARKKFFPSASNLSRRVTDNAQFSTVLEGEFNGRSKKISEQGNHRNRNVNESDLLRLCTVGRDGVWEGSFDDDVFPSYFFHPITGQFTDSPEARKLAVNVDFGNPFASREMPVGEVWASQRRPRKRKKEEAGEEEGVFAFAKVEEDEKEQESVPPPPASSTTPPVTPKEASPPSANQALTEAQLTDDKNKPNVRLPKDWVVAWSRSNKRWYFYNIPTKKSVWELAHVK